jgi:eukaryotic-like serine/threonine-protein kinase
MPEALGDFRIVREVGRGGMAIVYEAEQLSLGRRVALKVLPFAATMDSKQLQRFQNEARAAASLHHEHIVPVYAVGCERAVHFYAMQFIEGTTLASVIAETKKEKKTTKTPRHKENNQENSSSCLGDLVVDSSSPADATTAYTEPAAPATAAVAAASTLTGPQDKTFFRQVAKLGIQAAEALEHAHSLGVVHRDIKPGNLLLDAQGKLWVTDFGLARTAADAGLTISGDLVGTLRYMSPEQALARHGLVDHRTDVYALGATLYELLTGRPVVMGEEKQEILRQIAFEEPVAPRKLNRAIPMDLETIVLKAIEKNPEDRYAAAQLLANDLRSYLADLHIVARRPTLVQRARKWSRQHPSVVASATVALVLAVVALTVSNVLIAREKDAKDHALDEKQAALQIAKEELATREAALNFVENKVFAAARPKGQQGGLGYDVPLHKALEAAIPYVEKSFKNEPLTEARLRRTLGLSFHYLGNEKIAVQQFQRAIALYTTHRGSDHPDTLASMNNLANSYAGLGRHEDALRLRAQTLALRRAKLGDDDAATLDSMNNLANSYDKFGQFDEALKLREETLERRRRTLGVEHRDTLVSVNNLALSLANLGRHADALNLRENTLNLMKEKLPEDHPYILAAMNNLAESYATIGRCEDALQLYEQTLAVTKNRFKENHPNTLLVMNDLAWLLATAQNAKYRNPDRAVELAAQAAKASPETPEFSGTLGTARYLAGDWEQAALDLQNAIDLRGPDDSRNANEGFFLAMARWQLGDKVGAKKSFDMAMAWMNKSRSRDDEVRRFRAEAAKLLGINENAKRLDQQPLK